MNIGFLHFYNIIADISVMSFSCTVDFRLSSTIGTKVLQDYQKVLLNAGFICSICIYLTTYCIKMW
jgi:hypothetical protein